MFFCWIPEVKKLSSSDLSIFEEELKLFFKFLFHVNSKKINEIRSTKECRDQQKSRICESNALESN